MNNWIKRPGLPRNTLFIRVRKVKIYQMEQSYFGDLGLDTEPPVTSGRLEPKPNQTKMNRRITQEKI